MSINIEPLREDEDTVSITIDGNLPLMNHILLYLPFCYGKMSYAEQNSAV
jgi:hypothetical protein